MQQAELISVIVPVYNVDMYLERCIKSILNQNYNYIELILVDDGSTDGSGNICDKYSIDDNRVKVIHKQNGGLSDARNVGINNMQGEYLTFIDSDDFIHPKFLEKLYNNLIENEAELSIINYRKFMYEDELCENIEIKDLYEKKVFHKREALNALYNNEYKYQFTMACGKLYKKYIFKDLRFPSGRNYEDTTTAPHIINSCNTIIYDNTKLYYYYTRENSITKSDNYLRDDAFLSERDCRDFYLEEGYKELVKLAEQRYLTTLIGVYVRMYSETDDLSKRRQYIYNIIKGEYIQYSSIINRRIKKQVYFFILFPEFYKWVIRRIH